MNQNEINLVMNQFKTFIDEVVEELELKNEIKVAYQLGRLHQFCHTLIEDESNDRN